MTVIFVDGDIFQTQDKIALVHGCNCAGVMGKGIAIEFKRRWPMMYQSYRQQCEKGTFKLGYVFIWNDNTTGRVIFNLGTQQTWQVKATLSSIRIAMTKTLDLAEKFGIKTICMPMIGAGLGGLKSKKVKLLLVEIATDSIVKIIVCEQYVAGKLPI